MAYTTLSPITALDFNTFRTSLLDVYDVGNGNTGYGQGIPAALSSPVVAGVDVISSSHWVALSDTIALCANHQGTSTADNIPTAQTQVGNVISPYDGITNVEDLAQMLTDISTNRFLDATITSTTNDITLESTTATWSSQANAEYEYLWSSADNARYFFNSGGYLRIRLILTGGSATSKVSGWQQTLNNRMGDVTMNYNTTNMVGSGGTANSIGYYSLTTTYQTIATITDADFGGNRSAVIEARISGIVGTNGDNGDKVSLRITLTDPSGGAPDSIDGTLTFHVDEHKDLTYLTGIPSPTPTIVTPLTVV